MGESVVTFDLHLGRITVEGAGDHLAKILEAAIASVRGREPVGGDVASSSAKDPSDASNQAAGSPSLREFARKLVYHNFGDRITALLYYVNRIEGKAGLSSREVDALFGLCGFKKPTKMYSALKYAYWTLHYVERVGRDQWALSAAGENRALELIESSGVRLEHGSQVEH